MNSETSNKVSGEQAESQLFAGRYAMESIVSHGLGSVVWRARDERSGEAVALKFFPVEFVATTADLIALQQVIAAARRLELPGVAATQAIELHQGHAALVRPWIEGHSIDELRLTRNGNYCDVESIAPWVGAWAEALARLHSHRLIHGALQPGKLIIDSAGKLRLIDVGVSAWLLGAMQHYGGKVETSGSLPYFSPGRQVGDAMEPADDIYAFGAIVYELLTGKRPRTTFRRRMKRSRKRGSSPVPEEWEAVVRECLEKDPSLRIQSFEQILERLARWFPDQQPPRSVVSQFQGSSATDARYSSQPSPVRGPRHEAESTTVQPEPVGPAPDTGARFLRTLSALTFTALVAIGGWLVFHFVQVAPRGETRRQETTVVASLAQSASSPLPRDDSGTGGELSRHAGGNPEAGNSAPAESGIESLPTSDEAAKSSLGKASQSTEAWPESLSSETESGAASTGGEGQIMSSEARNDAGAMPESVTRPERRLTWPGADSSGMARGAEPIESTAEQSEIEAAKTVENNGQQPAERDLEQSAVGEANSSEIVSKSASIDADPLPPPMLNRALLDEWRSSETEKTAIMHDADFESPSAASRIDSWEGMETDVPAPEPEVAELPSEIATPPEIAADLEDAKKAEPTAEFNVPDAEEPRVDNPDTPQVVVQPPVTVTDDSEWTAGAETPSTESNPEASLLPNSEMAISPIEGEPRTTWTVSQRDSPERIALEALGLGPTVVPPVVKTQDIPNLPSVTESKVDGVETDPIDQELTVVDATGSAAIVRRASGGNDESGELPVFGEASGRNSTAPPGTEIESVRVAAPPPENQQMESTAQESTRSIPDEESAPESPAEVVEAPPPSPSVSSPNPPRPSEPPIDYDQIFGLGSVDAYPELLERTSPEIPRRLQRSARNARIEVEVVIDRMGRISSAIVRDASNRRLIEPSLEAVRSWRFRPARKDGRPVAVRTVLPLVFENGG